MTDVDLSEEIKNFINAHIRSVGHLEVLFLLGDDPARSWTAEMVSGELRTNPTYALSQLKELTAAGLVSFMNGKYASTSDPQLLDLVYKLRSAYNIKRSTVINYIYDQPLEKIKSFAEAFKLKKD